MKRHHMHNIWRLLNTVPLILPPTPPPTHAYVPPHAYAPISSAFLALALANASSSSSSSSAHASSSSASSALTYHAFVNPQSDDMDVDFHGQLHFIDSGKLFDKFTTLYQRAGIISTRNNVAILKEEAIKSEIVDFYNNEIENAVNNFNNHDEHDFVVDDARYSILRQRAAVNDIGHNILNVVARQVLNLTNDRNLKHGPESDFISFVFGKLLKEDEIFYEDSTIFELIIENLMTAMFIRIYQALNCFVNNEGHRNWAVSIFFLLDLFKCTTCFVSLPDYSASLVDVLHEGYGWLSMGK